jgi:hypothetical protein
MFKKTLLVTSALVAAFSTAALSEMKISGKQEFAYQTTSDKTSNVAAGYTGKIIGQESVLAISTSGDLKNGMKYSGVFEIEDGAEGAAEMGVSAGAFGLRFGSDTSGGTEKIKQIVPMVNNRRADIYAGTRGQGTSCPMGCDVEDVTSGENFIGISYSHPMATFDYAYTPNLGNAATSDTDKGATVAPSSTATPSTWGDSGYSSAGSGSSWSIKGGFGVEGLTVAYGQNTEENLTAGEKDAKSTIYGVAYNFGQIAAGYQFSKNESAAAAASVKKTETTDYSVTYAVSDDLSVGVLISDTSYKATPSTAAVNSDTTAFQVGYSLGAVSLHATYAEADNAYSTANRDWSILKLKAKLAF